MPNSNDSTAKQGGRSNAPDERDAEIMRLVQEVEAFLVLSRAIAGDAALAARSRGPASLAGLRDKLPDLAQAKTHVLDRLRAMAVAARDLRLEDGRPYRDARMLLTEQVLDHGRRFARSPGFAAERRAQVVAERVATLYPLLADRMREPKRITAIAEAIRANRGRPRRSWATIAACWKGIEDRDEERWRKDWHEFASGPQSKHPWRML